MPKLILGVDIGGVLVCRPGNGTTPSLSSDDYLKTEPIPGAFAALKRLAAEKFDEVYLISKGGAVTQEKTLRWLDHIGFYGRTGLPQFCVYFGYVKNDKAAICQQLDVTHFVDDRLGVLSFLPPQVETRYLFQGNPGETRQYMRFFKSVRPVNDWEEILRQELN